MQNTSYFCQILVKLEFSRQSFEKYSDIKFHENPSKGSRVVPCGQTDRHYEPNSHFSQFCERVQLAFTLQETAPNNCRVRRAMPRASDRSSLSVNRASLSNTDMTLMVQNYHKFSVHLNRKVNYNESIYFE
jgi:hypothetical protein